MLLQFSDAQAQEIPMQNSQYAEFPDTLDTRLSDFPHASCSVAVGGPGGQAGHNLQSRQNPHQNHAVTAGTSGFCPIYSSLFLSKPVHIPEALCLERTDCSLWLRTADLSFVWSARMDTSTQKIRRAEQPLCHPERSWWPVCQWMVLGLCQSCVGMLCSVQPPPSAEVNARHWSKTNANLYTIWHQFLSLDTIFCPLFSTCN